MDNEAIHKEAMDRFEVVWNLERDQRRLAIEDMRFAHSEDGQWSEDAITKRKDRPRYTLNRVAGAIDQIAGDQRQNRTQIKVRPVRGGDKDVAEVEQGLIRNIESMSGAESIYDAAFDEITTGGYGGWRVLTEFADDDTFEQEIFIERIPSAASSLFLDPGAMKQDKRDSLWGFYIRDFTTADFLRKYPDASVIDFDALDLSSDRCRIWFGDDKVRVAEYWRVDMVDTVLALLSDGRVINKDEESQVLDELLAQGISIVRERKAKIRKVESYILNGAEVIKGPMAWAGKFIPLVPVFGRTFDIEGRQFIRGIVRHAKDAQRIYNYASSTAIEATALTPKDPYWMTPAQAKGHGARLRTFNTNNSPFLIYNADPEAPGAPQRSGAPQVQAALIQQVAQAADDIHATTGLYAPAMGNAPQLLSEKSVIAQADKGDRATFVFPDNLHKAIKFTGDILLDLMPRIYDTARTVRILNMDGSTDSVEINQNGLDEFNQPIIDSETGQQVIVNDLSRGKYESVIEAGPAFSTRRQESAQQLIDLAVGSPVFERVATDLIAKNLNVLESDELTKRIRSQMIKDGTVEPTDEEIQDLGLDQKQEPSEEQKALLDNVKLQNAELMARAENLNAGSDEKDAKTLSIKMDAQQKSIKAYSDLLSAYKIQAELGINLGIDEHTLRKAQQGIIELSQDELVQNTGEL